MSLLPQAGVDHYASAQQSDPLAGHRQLGMLRTITRYTVFVSQGPEQPLARIGGRRRGMALVRSWTHHAPQTPTRCN